jgi:uncharacterized protein YjiS (DUF1127 family)
MLQPNEKGLRIMAIASTTPAPVEIRVFSRFSRILLGLRRNWVIRRTRASLAHLTDDQLRDIGLIIDDPTAQLDAHQRYWHKHLACHANGMPEPLPHWFDHR